MCIALISTAHPKYALVVVNNRDEFILRPTSQPHWWTIKVPSPQPSSPQTTTTTTTNGHPPPTAEQNGPNDNSNEETQHVLSSRDLLRAEQGAWLGITRAGHFAVLTNYRELDPVTGAPSVTGTKSRGAMVTAWLGSSSRQSVGDFVEGMIADGGTTGVGGFTLICGKLRRRRRVRRDYDDDHHHHQSQNNTTNNDDLNLEPLAVLSNKALHPDHIPWIAGARGETIGLSNAAFDNPAEWPKVKKGKARLDALLAEDAAQGRGEPELREALFGLLSRDELPRGPDMSLEDYFRVLQESIFIPPIGNQAHKDDMARAVAEKLGDTPPVAAGEKSATTTTTKQDEQQPSPPAWFSTGLYGTQRQTVILVDWEGRVTYTERSLFDANGVPIEKGQGDETFHFSIEGWDQDQDQD